MVLIDEIAGNEAEFTAWRHALHANPGIGFEEVFAADMVERKLRDFGFDEVHPGVGRTGVVGVLHGRRKSNRKIGLRADMDALPIEEETGRPYASTVSGRMHACGHDGHTATLLAAAWHLARTRDFAGTVHFIFQPAEEGLGGALAMLEDGLLDRFPCDRIYAWHNYPTFGLGEFYSWDGTCMAGCTYFTLHVQGRGGHAAHPQDTIDTTQIAAGIVLGAQSIVARNVEPLETGVLSFTDVYAGTNSHNVIPDKAVLKGCLRYFDGAIGDRLKTRLEDIARNIAAAYGGTVRVDYNDNHVPLINDAGATERALAVAVDLVGAENVHPGIKPFTGSEDFAYMSQRVPCNYVLIGSGPGHKPHHPKYDFNDAIIKVAASYLCRLVESELA